MANAILLVLSVVFLTSCKSGGGKKPEQVRAEDRDKIQHTLEQEMTLKQDRQQLETLRKDIPTEKQKQNDELALFLNLMKQGTEQPNLVREKFSTLVQRKRSDFRAKVARLREDFRNEETRKREDFLKVQKDKREAFTRKKPTSKENREFFSDQDRDRSRFFSDERDRRSSFEAEIQAQSRDFDSYMRERTYEFNEQFRLYSKQFSEKPKEKKAVTGEAGSQTPSGSGSRGFDQLKDIPSTPLGTDP